MRSRLAWYAALTTLVVCVVATLIWRELYRPIASFDLGNGRRISIWSERPLKFDDMGVRMLMCEVRDAHGGIGPPCCLGGDRGRPLEFRIVFADGKNLAGVYLASDGSGSCRVLLYDSKSRECYPNHLDEDLWVSQVRRKWAERHARLKQANPELPNIWELTEEYWERWK